MSDHEITFADDSISCRTQGFILGVVLTFLSVLALSSLSNGVIQTSEVAQVSSVAAGAGYQIDCANPDALRMAQARSRHGVSTYCGQ